MTAVAMVLAERISWGLDLPTLTHKPLPLPALVATVLLPNCPQRHAGTQQSQPPPPPPESALLNSSAPWSGCRRAAHSTASTCPRPCSPPAAHGCTCSPSASAGPRPLVRCHSLVLEGGPQRAHLQPVGHPLPSSHQTSRPRRCICRALRPWVALACGEQPVQPCQQGTCRFTCPFPCLGLRRASLPRCRHASHVGCQPGALRALAHGTRARVLLSPDEPTRRFARGRYRMCAWPGLMPRCAGRLNKDRLVASVPKSLASCSVTQL